MLSEKKEPEHVFEEQGGGLRHNLPALITSTLAEALARTDDVDLAKKNEIAGKFWKVLYKTASEWNMDTEFNELSLEDALRATDILYENYDYWLNEYP